MIAILAISSTVLDWISQAQDEVEQSDHWLAQREHPGLTRVADGFVEMKELFYVLELPVHLGIR